jgi:hypothetical protein
MIRVNLREAHLQEVGLTQIPTGHNINWIMIRPLNEFFVSLWPYYKPTLPEGMFLGWGISTRTLVPWKQGFRHPTRNECMGWFAQILFLDPKFLEPGNLMQIQPKTILPGPLQTEDTCTTYEPNKRPRLQPLMSAHHHMSLPGNTKPDDQSCHKCLICANLISDPTHVGEAVTSYYGLASQVKGPILSSLPTCHRDPCHRKPGWNNICVGNVRGLQPNFGSTCTLFYFNSTIM